MSLEEEYQVVEVEGAMSWPHPARVFHSEEEARSKLQELVQTYPQRNFRIQYRTVESWSFLDTEVENGTEV